MTRNRHANDGLYRLLISFNTAADLLKYIFHLSALQLPAFMGKLIKNGKETRILAANLSEPEEKLAKISFGTTCHHLKHTTLPNQYI